MLYGPDKARQIARSVLPSTSRKRVREELADIKRQNRHLISRHLHLIATDPEWYFDGGEKHDLTYYPNAEIMEVVWERRLGDKLGALMRWAPRITVHLDNPDSRYYFVKDILPQNLAGRHAMTHVVQLDEFDAQYEHTYRFSRRGFEDQKRRRKEQAVERRDRLIAGISEALGNHRHAKINRALKRAHKPGHPRWRWRNLYNDKEVEIQHCSDCERPRMLLGAHDVEAFVDHLLTTGHEEWREALEAIDLWD